MISALIVIGQVLIGYVLTNLEVVAVLLTTISLKEFSAIATLESKERTELLHSLLPHPLLIIGLAIVNFAFVRLVFSALFA